MMLRATTRTILDKRWRGLRGRVASAGWELGVGKNLPLDYTALKDRRSPLEVERGLKARSVLPILPRLGFFA